MPHPGNHGSFSPLSDRNTFCPSDSAAPNRRGMIGNGLGKPLGEVSMVGMEGKERQHGFCEVFDVSLLDLLTSLGIGFFAFGEAFGGSLGFEFGTNPVDGRSWCPDAP